jgi:hypothetical protein
VGECEGMSPHNPKWIGILMNFLKSNYKNPYDGSFNFENFGTFDVGVLGKMSFACGI